MADSKDTPSASNDAKLGDTKPGDNKLGDIKSDASGGTAKTGPVRPPVLEGTARHAPNDPAPSDPIADKGQTAPKTDGVSPARAASAPEAKPESKPEFKADAKPDAKPGPSAKSETSSRPPPAGPGPAKSASSAPAASSSPPSSASAPASSGAGAAWLAGLVGGLVALGAAYGLAFFGYWPSVPGPGTGRSDTRLAELAAAVPALERLGERVEGDLAALATRLETLETSPPDVSAPPPDLEPIKADISALHAQLAALAAATPDEGEPVSSALAEALAGLRADFSGLESEADAAATRIADIDSTLADLKSALSGLGAQVEAASAAEAGRTQLPLILSGLETAFAGGRAYDAELAAVRRVLPALAVPEAVAEKAGDGLQRADAIVAAFSASLPDIMAARPIDGTAGWQGAVADWFGGVIALRPTGEVEGSAPEAVVARLEAALARHDFATAEAELAALPPAMRAMAEPVAADIAARAAATAFLAEVRAAALAEGEGA